MTTEGGITTVSEKLVAYRRDPSRQQAARVEDSPTEAATAVAERLEELHRTCRRPLLSYLIRLTLGDARLAEDIVQETFVRAWLHLKRRGDADVDAFRPWLYTVARHLVVDATRARKSRPVEVGVNDLAQLMVTGDNTASLTRVLAIREALMRLQPGQRTLLMDLYYHGRTFREVADELSIPVGTVKSRAYYAKRVLRSYLDQQECDSTFDPQ